MDDRGVSLSDNAIPQFWRDGYIVVPTVFSHSIIDQAKAALLREAEAANLHRTASPRLGSLGFPKSAAAYPAARDLMFSDSVVSVVAQLLGHRPIYFGDSSVNYGSGYTGWHKDNRVSDRKDGAAPDWQGDYDLIRVGIYLQDCAAHSGGLLVRAGSHNDAPRLPAWARNGKGRLPAFARRANAFRSRFYGEARFVNTMKGDMVVWTLRTTHAGHAVRIKGLPKLLLDPRMQQVVPKFLQVPIDGPRLAIFATFARPGSHYQRYREYIVGRDYFVRRPYVSVEELLPPTVTLDEIKYSQPGPE
ncbi:MAG: phytanoyl-CoA dioxygenase family protein [Woeseiaceae bacterium]